MTKYEYDEHVGKGKDIYLNHGKSLRTNISVERRIIHDLARTLICIPNRPRLEEWLAMAKNNIYNLDHIYGKI